MGPVISMIASPRQSSAITWLVPGWFAIMACATMVVPAARAADGDIGVETIRADVPVPEGASESNASAARDELAKRIAERIRARFEAAEVKYARVHIEDGILTVKVGGDVTSRLAAGIAFPPGEAELRPVVHVGGQWQEQLTDVPETVDLRQGDQLLDRNDAYLWSPERALLQSFVDDVSLSGAEAFVYVGEDGWRTMSLGPPALTTSDLRESRIEFVQNGRPYVALKLTQTGRQELERRSEADHRRWALVVDGEIVTVLKHLKFTEGALLVSTPKHLSSDDASLRWARQVAGRLMAPIPVPLAELSDD